MSETNQILKMDDTIENVDTNVGIDETYLVLANHFFSFVFIIPNKGWGIPSHLLLYLASANTENKMEVTHEWKSIAQES